MMKLAEKLADCLMRDVYYPFSACVGLDESGKICTLKQFDTAFCKPPEPDCLAAEILLLSNHPDGNMRPTPEDWKNFEALRKCTCSKVRMIIVSEDNGCVEIQYPRS